MIGKTILHYKILEKLGEGGMGIVFKAEDTKLNREVAIKVLPPHLLVSEEDRSRFHREAKAAAALNHSNIATVYEINEQDEKPFIVMEFVDGQTLNHHIEKGPFKLRDAVSIAIQVAEGLKAAHAKDIVHRDIKSSNILLSTNNHTKILDFGLAKTSMSTKLTQMGTTIGTVGYMSPEQVKGFEVDHRTDLWSLGIVLYEMVSGRLPFAAEYDQAIFYSIQNEAPEPLTAIRTGVPMSLEWIVDKLLAKDAGERYQTADDLIIDLKAIDLNGTGFSRVSSSSIKAKPVSQQTTVPEEKKEEETSVGKKSIIPWVISVVMLAGLLIMSFLFFSQPDPEQQVIRTSISIIETDKPAFTFRQLEGGHFAISHDGTLLTYVALDSTGKGHLWVRRLDALSAQKLAGTEGATYPFWSADNRFIGFFASGKLKKINASGGPALTICDAANGRSGTWNRENIIVFAPDQVGEIYRVSAGGGTPQKITTLDSTRDERTHRWPFFLPDGKHFLYFARISTSRDSETDAIYVSSLDSSVNKIILNIRTNVAYAHNYVLYSHDNTLMARRFDEKKLEFVEDARPLAENLKYSTIFSKGAFSVSQNGLLVYQSGASTSGQNLVWYDRNGSPGNTIGPLEAYRWMRLSNDEKKAVISIYDPESRQEDLWLHDFTRDIRTRFTFDPAWERMCVWSPDDQTIIFNSNRDGNHYNLYLKNASGSGETTLLFKDEMDKYPTDWTADGRFMTYTSTGDPQSKWDIWIMSMESNEKGEEVQPYPLLNSKFFEGPAAFSPNGKWIAYNSDESGEDEVYVRPFSGPGGKWQISINGGYDPYWRQDGKEIYYGANNNKMMAVKVTSKGDILEVGSVTVLFEMPTGANLRAVTKDGQRFILRVPIQEKYEQPLTLVMNWQKELEAK
jgi:serine/threonine protein kinase